MKAPAGVDLTPGMGRFRNAWGGMWRGLASGAVSGLGMSFLGAVPGTLAGGLLAAAVLGGNDGRMVAIYHGAEAAQLFFVGGGE